MTIQCIATAVCARSLINNGICPKAIALKSMVQYPWTVSTPNPQKSIFKNRVCALANPVTFQAGFAIGAVLEALEVQVRVQRPFVLVVGASDSGKSSLVRAGVLPLLTQTETIEGVELWLWAITRPGAGGSDADCFDALAAALLEAPALPALKDPDSLNPIRDQAFQLREHSKIAPTRVRDALDHAAREYPEATFILHISRAVAKKICGHDKFPGFKFQLSANAKKNAEQKARLNSACFRRERCAL